MCLPVSAEAAPLPISQSIHADKASTRGRLDIVVKPHNKRALTPTKCHESCWLLRDCCWYASDTRGCMCGLTCNMYGCIAQPNTMQHKAWCDGCLTGYDKHEIQDTQSSDACIRQVLQRHWHTHWHAHTKGMLLLKPRLSGAMKTVFFAYLQQVTPVDQKNQVTVKLLKPCW
jgi:hypothetical protein